MRGIIITCMEIPESIKASARCAESGKRFGVDMCRSMAFTPKDRPDRIFEERGWPLEPFTVNRYCRAEPCMATLLSHHSLWELSSENDEPIIVCQHDAVFVSELPDLSECRGVCNLAHPSFGKWKTPKKGLGPLTSKHFLPGAHGYYVHPEGARKLIAGMHDAQPTDVYLGRKRFPWLEEFYPWPIKCDDSFSTIQVELGASAHHNKIEVLDCW